jgi:hypothetical protein
MSTFDTKAPKIMSALLSDFPIGLMDAAAIVGNLGHESGGFDNLQEIKPTIAGSRGGFGWAQWTGPRRREYEAYCQRNRLNPASDRANYAYLFVELKGPERKAIPAVVAADGLQAKVEAFEQSFERAGVKHYPSRLQWAQRALTAWNEADADERAPDFLPAPVTVPETPVTLPDPIILPETAPMPTPAPSQEPVGSPVEKAIGAGKGSAQGSVIGGTAGALIIMGVQLGWIPEAADNAMFGGAVALVLTSFGSFVMAVIGAYRAPANSTN